MIWFKYFTGSLKIKIILLIYICTSGFPGLWSTCNSLCIINIHQEFSICQHLSGNYGINTKKGQLKIELYCHDF